MADAGKARPVSGEIMAAGARDTCAQSPRLADADVVDADFEIVEAIGDRDESAEPQPGRAPGVPATGGMDILRPAEDGALPKASRGGPVFWTAGISLAAMAFWVSGGHAVLRDHVVPAAFQTQSLRLSEINSRVDVSGRRPVLLVDGVAVNDGNKAAALPPIDISVAGEDGKILRYRLGTAAAHVAPGARWDFSSRLDLPMNGVRTVTVAFSE